MPNFQKSLAIKTIPRLLDKRQCSHQRMTILRKTVPNLYSLILHKGDAVFIWL